MSRTLADTSQTHHRGWKFLLLLLSSLPPNQPPLPSPRLPDSVKSQGSPTPCCISYLHTYALAHFLVRKGEKPRAAKRNLVLLEVYAGSLELWGSHQKLIVLEGVARPLPLPNLISRLCNKVRIRATLKLGRDRKNSTTNQVLKLARCLLPVSPRNHPFY